MDTYTFPAPDPDDRKVWASAARDGFWYFCAEWGQPTVRFTFGPVGRALAQHHAASVKP